MKRFSSITTTQLARICGVSQGTVDRALHDRPGIDPQTKERILAVAREYEYVPHVPGSNAKQSMLIGVVLFDLYNEFFSKLAMSLVEKAKALGYSVTLLFSNKDIKTEKSAIDYFNYIGVDGIVLFSVGSNTEEYKNYLHSINRLIVTIGNRLFDLPYVGIDDTQAMYDLTQHMLSEVSDGLIQYFAPSLKKKIFEGNAQLLRVEGFKNAMEEAHRPYQIVTEEEALSSDAASIICSTDYYALKVLKKLGSEHKVKVAGFDHISMLRYLPHSIFTVDYSTDEIAAECLNFFLKRKYTPQVRHSVVPSTDEE